MNKSRLVDKKKIGDQILDILRSRIMLGEIESGIHLKETVLSKELEVSRGPIREAIVQLENEGLVSTPPNGRTIVEGFSYQDIEDLYSTRVVLEKFALSQFKQSAYERRKSELQACIDLMEEAIERKEKEVNADLKFHFLIVEFSENKTLTHLWKSMIGLTRTVIEVTQDFTMTKEIATLEEHKKISYFLSENNIEEASDALAAHLLSASSFYKKAVTELRRDDNEWQGKLM